jgi:hypothetical protein
MTTTTPYFESDMILDLFVEETHFRGFSVGYELKEFRYDEMVDLIFSALADFTLSDKEKASMNQFNSHRRLKKAAKIVYGTEKYKSRGEYGEILLHLLLRDYFHSIPAISKMYYKDGANETVKGFDAVHIVPNQSDLELWLGEVKFYNEINRAIRDVVQELQYHTDKDYLRNEFLFITNKIDDSWEYADKLRKLIDERTSLDTIFTRIRIPVLLTYDSDVVKNYREVHDEYKQALIEELNKNHTNFRSKNLPTNVDIFLILVPLEHKEILINKLHNKLRIWQQL